MSCLKQLTPTLSLDKHLVNQTLAARLLTENDKSPSSSSKCEDEFSLCTLAGLFAALDASASSPCRQTDSFLQKALEMWLVQHSLMSLVS